MAQWGDRWVQICRRQERIGLDWPGSQYCLASGFLPSNRAHQLPQCARRQLGSLRRTAAAPAAAYKCQIYLSVFSSLSRRRRRRLPFFARLSNSGFLPSFFFPPSFFLLRSCCLRRKSSREAAALAPLLSGQSLVQQLMPHSSRGSQRIIHAGITFTSSGREVK